MIIHRPSRVEARTHARLGPGPGHPRIVGRLISRSDPTASPSRRGGLPGFRHALAKSSLSTDDGCPPFRSMVGRVEDSLTLCLVFDGWL
jgi:hypothetical protein